MSPVAAPQPVSVAEPTDFEAIYRQYARLVYRTAWGVLGSPEDAEDVVQAIFLKLLRNEGLPTLQKDPQAYFYKAAVNASLDVLKARRRRPVLVGDIEQLGVAAPDTTAGLDDDVRRRLYEAIAQLSADAARKRSITTSPPLARRSTACCDSTRARPRCLPECSRPASKTK